MQHHIEGSRAKTSKPVVWQLKAAGDPQLLFDDTARHRTYQAAKGIPRKVNELAMTALRLAAAGK